MTDIKTLCVYCGSSGASTETYGQVADDIGGLCARNGWTLVYGGSRNGLMGRAADSALAAGGRVIGVIPEDLGPREIAHPGLSELHVTRSIHERQMMMATLSDAFVTLPGGLGTLAEFFEILTWRQLGFHSKPVILLNSRQYWSPLLETVARAREEGFLYERGRTLFHVAEDVHEIPVILKSIPFQDDKIEISRM